MKANPTLTALTTAGLVLLTPALLSTEAHSAEITLEIPDVLVVDGFFNKENMPGPDPRLIPINIDQVTRFIFTQRDSIAKYLDELPELDRVRASEEVTRKLLAEPQALDSHGLADADPAENVFDDGEKGIRVITCRPLLVYLITDDEGGVEWYELLKDKSGGLVLHKITDSRAYEHPHVLTIETHSDSEDESRPQGEAEGEIDS